jgi:DNA-binding NtrC family response regulator
VDAVNDVPTTSVVGDDDAPGDPVLVVLGIHGLARHPMPARGRVVIGRAPDADVVLADASVSRRHAAIELGDQLAIEDLGSANGTAVRGRRVDARTPLDFGDPVQLGSLTVLVVRDRRRLAAVAPAAGGPVIADPRMKTIAAVVQRVAAGDLGVLLTGETGCGKEVLAELLHAASPRARGPFVRINCAALPEGLVEAELFGHERGAFTGATANRRGLIEEADGGTLFLDEVGELAAASQAKLLRVLEDRTVRPVGARASVAVDVRIVSATHRDLRDATGFRSDLYYRLAGIVIAVPPLRERPADVVPLAEHFLARAAAAGGRPAPSLGAAARAWLATASWPGNVRELRNAIDRAVLLCDDQTIEVPHLTGEAIGPADEGPPTLRDTLGEVERARLRDVLEACGWNQSEAARRLGLSRNTLAARIRAHGLRRP